MSDTRLYDQLEKPRDVVERAAKEAARLLAEMREANPYLPRISAEKLLTTYFNSLLILEVGRLERAALDAAAAAGQPDATPAQAEGEQT